MRLRERTVHERRRSRDVDDCRRRARADSVLFDRRYHQYLPEVEDRAGDRGAAVEDRGARDQRLLQQRHRLVAE